MKLISWNVNGLRACLGKGFLEFCQATDPDVICLQETKMKPEQAEFDLPGYTRFWNSADKAGYSGTALFTKRPPLSVTYDFGDDQHRHEGRVITAEFEDFYLVCCYTPNSKDELKRLDYRMVWEDDFRSYLCAPDPSKPVVPGGEGKQSPSGETAEPPRKKPVILCGDLNVAATEIDLKNPKSNEKNPGYSIQERQKFRELLDAGFTDAFRYLYPDKTGAYTWWSYRMKAREKNVGWRIDYFVVQDELRDKIKDVILHDDVFGSDHCPIELDIAEAGEI
ncbi:MAG: exodeoxyribonuclease III [Oscillibacter sp.]